MLLSLAWMVVVALLGAPPASPTNPLDIGSAPAETIIVMREAGETPDEAILESPMLAKLAGAITVIKGSAAKAFRAAGPGSVPIEPIADAERIGFVHLLARGQQKTIELAQTQAGAFVVFEHGPTGERGRGTVLKSGVLGPMLASWDLYEGGFDAPRDVTTGAERRAPDAGDPPAIGAGGCTRLDGPYLPGWFTLDQEALGERLLSGGNTTVSGMERVLATQELWVRVPKGYDPRRPAGVVVWMDPGETGQIPVAYGGALDELGLLAIGAAGMGNTRAMGDRLQLAMDGLATVARRFHIDPQRTYATGVSGGGRLSSMLVACFPDVFTGAVPVVGLSCYENLPTGVGGYWAGGFRKPPAKMFAIFKKRPVAAITGGRDFNQPEMQRAVEVYQRDGCRVKLFDYEDQAHTVPTEARLREALRWVDEPARAARLAEEKAVAAELKKLRAAVERKPLPVAELTREVARITKLGPWTTSAWEAVAMLKGVEPGALPRRDAGTEAPAPLTPPAPSGR